MLIVQLLNGENYRYTGPGECRRTGSKPMTAWARQTIGLMVECDESITYYPWSAIKYVTDCTEVAMTAEEVTG